MFSWFISSLFLSDFQSFPNLFLVFSSPIFIFPVLFPVISCLVSSFSYYVSRHLSYFQSLYSLFPASTSFLSNYLFPVLYPVFPSSISSLLSMISEYENILHMFSSCKNSNYIFTEFLNILFLGGE